MLESRDRFLQWLAAQRFYEEASGDFTFFQEEPSNFTEDELREEAAFRCWLREVDARDCQTLPSSTTLHVIADAYDWLYGEHVWWSWPIWSSCEHCSRAACAPVALCVDCQSYMHYCVMSQGWADSFPW